MSKVNIDKKYLIDRQGKTAVVYAGLLEAAHNAGLKRITTRMLQAPAEENRWTAIFHAEVELGDGSIFTGTGDANVENVARMVAPHFIRMGETRAKARALRDALSITDVVAEELDDDVDRQTGEIVTKPATTPTAQRIANTPTPTSDDLGKPKPGDRVVAKDDLLWTDKTHGLLARLDKAQALGVDLKAICGELGITSIKRGLPDGLTITQVDTLRGRLGSEIASQEPAREPVTA